jgi:two-component system chemotaxis sensor kinase CheA
MAIDMRQFQATFFAESREGLDAMESGLLSLEAAGNDLDTVNTIFRAAHSIKGGAATFGFKAITNTTHLLETLLDQVRGGKRSVDGELSDALLASVDILRELLSSAEAGNPDDTGRSEPLNARLSELLNGAPAAAPAVLVQSASAPAPQRRRQSRRRRIGRWTLRRTRTCSLPATTRCESCASSLAWVRWRSIATPPSSPR